MKRVFLLLAMLGSLTFMNAQTVITANDMPQPGDTARTSMTLLLEGFDYQATGENWTWDFADLTVMMQQVDTFDAVTSTPVIYQFVFNNQFIYPDHKATVARQLMEFNQIPNLEVSDTYQFLKLADDEFREVGLGITLAGVPIPMAYQDIDTLYRFPLEYGDLDSAHSAFSLDIPDLGYLEIDKKRVNQVDGWGTLITPYGQYQALRVKTEIDEYDSVYVDSLNVGFPVQRNYTEYKWLVNGFPVPMLTVNEENLVATATYIDSVRTSFVGVKEELQETDFNFKVYPNPAAEQLSVSYELLETADVVLSFYSLYGKEVRRVMHTRQDRGLYNKLINLRETNLDPGLYLILLQIDHRPMVKRVLIN